MAQVCTLQIIFSLHVVLSCMHRLGVISDDELDSDSKGSVDFLMAKLKRAQIEKVI